MSRLVLEIHNHSGDGGILHRSLDRFPATLGRGYHNDVILSDPHVSPHHLRFDHGAEGWTVTDLGSDNGLIVNDQVRRGTAPLASGDVLRVGHTEIRAFDPEHPVPTTQRLQRASPMLVWLARPLHVWLSFLSALGVAAAYSYLEIWDEEVTKQVTYATAAMLGLILVWSALWAVAGKLIQHKSRFRSHVAFISLLLIVDFTVVSNLEGYTEFLSNQNWVSAILHYALSLTMMVGLVYGCLTLATGMSNRRRLHAAGYFSVGIMVGAWTLAHVAEMHFNAEPKYPAHLRPYLAELAPTDSLQEFMASNKDLFQSSVLKLPDQPKK
jgi:pSer/pThr/pTyr-binding forkhead associated (FHA) protein